MVRSCRRVRGARRRDALPLRPLHLAVGRGGNVAHDAWTTLAGLAARTRTLRFGTLVSPPPSASPRCSRTRWRRSITSRAAGSSSVSAPAGWSASTARTASRSRRRPRASRCSPSSSRSSTGSGRRSASTSTATHYTLEDAPAQPKPVQQPRPPTRRRQRNARHRRACRAFRRRVQHALRLARGLRAYPSEGRNTPARHRPHVELLDHDRLPDRRHPRRRTGARTAAVRRAPREPSFDDWLDGYSSERSSARWKRSPHGSASTRSAGCERVMLQHLLHADLEPVALIGRLGQELV